MGKIKSSIEEWTPGSRVSTLLPKVSGNSVNGLDEAEWRAPQPVFWRIDDSIEHGDILQYFYKLKVGEKISKSRKFREERINIPLSDIVDIQVQKTPEKWKELTLSLTGRKMKLKHIRRRECKFGEDRRRGGE